MKKKNSVVVKLKNCNKKIHEFFHFISGKKMINNALIN